MYAQPVHRSAGRWMIFGDRCPSAPARSRETSERWGRRWRIPLRPRPGLHIKSGRRGGCSSGAGGGGGGAPLRSRSSLLSSAVEAHSPPSLAAALRGLPAGTMRGRDFPLVLLALVLCQAPRGPAAPVSAGGGTLLAKMYPRGNHWAVGECPARSSPGGTSQPRGPVSPSLSFSAALRWGLGFAPTFPLRRQPRSPKTPLCPSVSREAVGPSAASGWSLGPFPLSSLHRRTPEPARSSPKSQPYAEITLPPHLPAPPFIRLITTLSGTVLSLNNFGELGPRARLGALVQPGGCAFTPDKATGVGHRAQRPPWVSNLFGNQRLNPTSIWDSPEFPQSFFALQRFSFP